VKAQNTRDNVRCGSSGNCKLEKVDKCVNNDRNSLLLYEFKPLQPKVYKFYHYASVGKFIMWNSDYEIGEPML
jgi:hypothetical protein